VINATVGISFVSVANAQSNATAEAGAFDLLSLRKQYPQWLPAVDTVYGSGAFLPLVDQGHYSVSLMRSGALVARPDEATQQKIGQPLGG